MTDKIIMPKYLDFKDITILIDMFEQSSSPNDILSRFAEKLATRYWSNISVLEHMHPHEIYKGMMHNLTLSNWFEITGIEMDEKAIKIIIKLDFDTNTKKLRCNFLASFIGKLTSIAYGTHNQAEIKQNDNGVCIFIFKNEYTQK